MQRSVVGPGPERRYAFLVDLARELTRRREHECERAVARLRDRLRVDVHERGQQIGQRLAATGDGDADQIKTLHRDRPRLPLNWCWRRESGGCDGIEQVLWKGGLHEAAHRVWAPSVGAVCAEDANAECLTQCLGLCGRERRDRRMLNVKIARHARKGLVLVGVCARAAARTACCGCWQWHSRGAKSPHVASGNMARKGLRTRIEAASGQQRTPAGNVASE